MKLHSIKNKILIFIFLAFVFLNRVYGGDLDNPDLTMAIEPIQRIFNLVIYVAGAVFIGVILFAAIKISLSFGDPRGLEGGKKTLTYAIAGVAIVLGFFTVTMFLIQAIAGEEYFWTSPMGIFEALRAPIDGLMEAARVTRN